MKKKKIIMSKKSLTYVIFSFGHRELPTKMYTLLFTDINIAVTPNCCTEKLVSVWELGPLIPLAYSSTLLLYILLWFTLQCRDVHSSIVQCTLYSEFLYCAILCKVNVCRVQRAVIISPVIPNWSLTDPLAGNMLDRTGTHTGTLASHRDTWVLRFQQKFS